MTRSKITKAQRLESNCVYACVYLAIFLVLVTVVLPAGFFMIALIAGIGH
jgi:pilus assembly protein TadC